MIYILIGLWGEESNLPDMPVSAFLIIASPEKIKKKIEEKKMKKKMKKMKKNEKK